MNRLLSSLAGALRTTAEDVHSSLALRGLLIVLLLVLLAVSGVLAVVRLQTDPTTIGTRSDARSAEGSPALDHARSASPQASDGVAGSRQLVADFDMLPTGSRIDGWTLTDGARLRTAAQPTAVDRSALLDGDRGGTACHGLDVPFTRLAATFMIDPMPKGRVVLLMVALTDDASFRLTLAGSSATVAPDGPAVELKPGTWYRWAVVADDRQLGLSLAGPDGRSLLDANVPWPGDARASEFCMTAAPGSRLYLSDVTVEAR